MHLAERHEHEHEHDAFEHEPMMSITSTSMMGRSQSRILIGTGMSR